MNIQTLSLKNYTVFENIQIDVSTGINIFVGEITGFKEINTKRRK